MANLQTYDAFVSRFANGFDASEPIYGDLQTAGTGTLVTGQSGAIATIGTTTTFPTLPAGVSGYIVTSLDALSSTGGSQLLVAKAVNLGNLSLATPTFTAGSTMPTLTEGNNSNQTYSLVMAEVTTVLNATPGNFTITYNASDGSSGNTTASNALTGSASLHTCGFVTLNSGHWGASQITGATRTGGTTPTGVITFWGLLPICSIHQGWNSSVPAFRNLLTASLNPLRLGAADVIKFFSLASGSTRGVTGTLTIIGDS